MTEPKIRVRIRAEQKVYYDQTRGIPVSLFEKYEAMHEACTDDSEFERVFEHLIDHADVIDWGDLEDIEITEALP